MDLHENDADLSRCHVGSRKPLLRARNPATARLLSSLPVELPERRSDLHSWTDNFIGDLNRWSAVRRRQGSLFGDQLIRRCDADAALTRALRAASEVANDDYL